MPCIRACQDPDYTSLLKGGQPRSLHISSILYHFYPIFFFYSISTFFGYFRHLLCLIYYNVSFKHTFFSTFLISGNKFDSIPVWSFLDLILIAVILFLSEIYTEKQVFIHFWVFFLKFSSKTAQHKYQEVCRICPSFLSRLSCIDLGKTTAKNIDID